MLLAIAGLATAWPAVAKAELGYSKVQSADWTTSADTTAVKTVSYTTDSAGHALNWLPYRPASGAVRSARKPAATATEDHAIRMATMLEPVETPAAAGGAMADPFGDSKAAPAQAPALLNLGSLQAAQPTQSPSDIMRGPLEPPGAPAAAPAAPATPAPTPQPQAAAPARPVAPKAVQPGVATPQAEVPSLEQELAVAPQGKAQECRSPKELKPIGQISYKIAPEQGEFPTDCPLGDDPFVPRAWPCVTFSWTASALCHKPLYFEEVQAERYGHSWGPFVQPLVSAGHFFLTIPVLPYAMGVCPPKECVYTLGYYRPGDCAPYMLDPIPLSVRGALAEGGVATGLAFLIP